MKSCQSYNPNHYRELALAARKNFKLNFLWPKMAHFGPRFDPKIPPEKVPFLRSFPGDEAHKLSSGGVQIDCWGRGQQAYVEKKYVFFAVP